jgi:hypothetical protein
METEATLLLSEESANKDASDEIKGMPRAIL